MITEWACNYLSKKPGYDPKRLVFHEATHSYFLDDKKVPSVTSINPYNALYYKRINSEILDNAIKRGNAFHDFVEGMIIEKWTKSKGEMSTATYEALLGSRPFLTSFLKPLTILMVEQPLFDNENGLFAGTVDCVAVDDEKKKLYVIDWKGSKSPTGNNASVLLRYRHQLDSYHYLLKTCFQSLVKDYSTEGIIVYLNQGNPVALNVMSGDIKVRINSEEWITKRN